MKRFLIYWLIASPIIFGLSYAGTRLDLALNSWLRPVSFHWTLFLTTKHAESILYADRPSTWFAFTLILSIVFGLFVAAVVASRHYA